MSAGIIIYTSSGCVFDYVVLFLNLIQFVLFCSDMPRIVYTTGEVYKLKKIDKHSLACEFHMIGRLTTMLDAEVQPQILQQAYL